MDKDQLTDQAMARTHELPDSGKRQEFDTGSVRDTRDGKGRFDLLPPLAMTRLAKHFEAGASKYGARNYERGQPLARFVDSALRHIFKLLEGRLEEDHAAAAAWNMMAFMEIQGRISGGRLSADLDDMPKREDEHE